jgi:hypothetical protein
MSSSRTDVSGIAVVGKRTGDGAAALAAFVEARGLSGATWYPPRDVDELDAAVRAGTVQTVVFAHLADMLRAGWDDRLTPQAWRAAGVAVLFADAAEPAPADPLSLLDAWSAWRKRQRRRQAVAGVILSVAALAAAFLVVRCGG